MRFFLAYGHCFKACRLPENISLQALEQSLKDFNNIRKMYRDGDYLILDFPSQTADLSAINTYCFQHGVVLTHLNMRKKSLETRFLELTN